MGAGRGSAGASWQRSPPPRRAWRRARHALHLAPRRAAPGAAPHLIPLDAMRPLMVTMSTSTFRRRLSSTCAHMPHTGLMTGCMNCLPSAQRPSLSCRWGVCSAREGGGRDVSSVRAPRAARAGNSKLVGARDQRLFQGPRWSLWERGHVSKMPKQEATDTPAPAQHAWRSGAASTLRHGRGLIAAPRAVAGSPARARWRCCPCRRCCPPSAASR